MNEKFKTMSKQLLIMKYVLLLCDKDFILVIN